ncbi:unnamed protein product [Moneuplotes crassus]|uniref:Uncharacterized protein n=1 Tax=Euplotes crassus TaxID=5936 RepID=A0AAD1UP91_EUPCR|nr:unnamed protein product [Moneuplotes crassus]
MTDSHPLLNSQSPLNIVISNKTRHKDLPPKDFFSVNTETTTHPKSILNLQNPPKSPLNLSSKPNESNSPSYKILYRSEEEDQVLHDQLDLIDKAIQEGTDVFKEVRKADGNLKVVDSLVKKISLCNSENVTHHLSQVVSDKEVKIGELKEEISYLQDLRVENDILRGKVKQLEDKVVDLETEINLFDYSKTVARKVEKDKKTFLDQLVKKRRSTNPADSSHYVHISKFHKLKDTLIAEKCKSADYQKEVINLNKTIADLREINDHMKESLRKFISQNQEQDELSLHSSMNFSSKNAGNGRKRSNLNASQLNSHFISKYLNKLRKSVESYDIYDTKRNKSMLHNYHNPTDFVPPALISPNSHISSPKDTLPSKFNLPTPSSKNYSTSRFIASKKSPLNKFL